MIQTEFYSGLASILVRDKNGKSGQECLLVGILPALFVPIPFLYKNIFVDSEKQNNSDR